jgi:hypothetical protein
MSDMNSAGAMSLTRMPSFHQRGHVALPRDVGGHEGGLVAARLDQPHGLGALLVAPAGHHGERDLHGGRELTGRVTGLGAARHSAAHACGP